MIFGRPTNLWLGLVTAVAGLVTSALIVAGVDPEVVAQLVGPTVTVLGALIVLVANQPPTVKAGDDINVVTPAGQPNATIQATIPPLEPEGLTL